MFLDGKFGEGGGEMPMATFMASDPVPPRTMALD